MTTINSTEMIEIEKVASAALLRARILVAEAMGANDLLAAALKPYGEVPLTTQADEMLLIVEAFSQLTKSRLDRLFDVIEDMNDTKATQ